MRSKTTRPIRSSRPAPHSDNESAPGSEVTSSDVSEESDPSGSSDNFSDSDNDAVLPRHKVCGYMYHGVKLRLNHSVGLRKLPPPLGAHHP